MMMYSDQMETDDPRTGIMIYMPESLAQKVRAEAARDGRSTSAWVKRLIEHSLEAQLAK